ncbi:MAG TPA: TatD family hydrolase [Longimicrobiaceae bacterium]|nr:TatD family hydrolase [Longimicrobiaceae bacterium]
MERLSVIDSHAHLTDERLLPEVDAVVERAREVGVETIVTIGTYPDSSREAVALAQRFPGVYATVGIHPHAAEGATEEAFAAIRKLVREPGVVALGETGLDYFYDSSPRADQRRSFLWHLELARETGLPVVVHARSADDDVRDILAEARDVTGVLHCFSSGRAVLERALEVGWYASFSGMITFKKYEDADLVRMVPADRILVETDAPYLAPAPFRGKTNEPAFVVHTARKAAEIRGEDPVKFAATTVRNTRAFYRLQAPSPRRRESSG